MISPQARRVVIATIAATLLAAGSAMAGPAWEPPQPRKIAGGLHDGDDCVGTVGVSLPPLALRDSAAADHFRVQVARYSGNNALFY